MAMESSEQHARLSVSSSCCRPPTTCPPWLQAAIADIEQRVRALAAPDDEDATAHSFAARADNYYEKRPQLLALLTDLHHRYLYLADRYSQSLIGSGNGNGKPSSSSSHASDNDDDRCSDADSSLSFQQQPSDEEGMDIITDDDSSNELGAVVAELVLAWVERDLLCDDAERRRAEAARKMELQGSLVEVLESERLVLLGENARLGFRASAAEDEAAAAAAELGYTRRRAAEMARLVVKLREEHRACVLGRRVEALQAQVYALELRNRECQGAMAAWEAERAEMGRLRVENRRLAEEATATSSRRKKGAGGWWWWARVRMAAEWTPCATTGTVRKVGEQMKVKDANYYGGGGCFCI